MNKTVRNSGVALACAGALVAVAAASPVWAEDAPAKDADKGSDKVMTTKTTLNIDFIGAISGGVSGRPVELDKLAVEFDFNFEKAGWKGGSGQLTLQNTSGHRPNEDVGALEGIDNIEVAGRRGRVFQAWLQQCFGSNGSGDAVCDDFGSAKAGVFDVDSEFGVNDAAAGLLGPQWGIASELAATGPAGVATYPLSALAARVKLKPTKDSYVMAALFDATIGTLGDPGGIDGSFHDGVFEIVEGGLTGDWGKLAVGGWNYSKKQDDQFAVDIHGSPIKRSSSGAYVLGNWVFPGSSDKGPKTTGFVRIGVSDGKTGPFKASWQTGLMVEHPFASRPDSMFSIGADQAQLGDSFRAASKAGGTPLGASETHFEITYADKITDTVTLQPDIQYILNPGGDKAARNATVGLIRLTTTF